MDIWSWLQEVTILIVVCEITIAERDLLESFRPKEDNPIELNEFLNNVLEHRSDFNLVKEAARKYQKVKKNIHLENLDAPLSQPMDLYNNLNKWYKTDKKRHIHNYHNVNKRFRRPMKFKQQRHRRDINKPKPEQIVIQPEGQKGEVNVESDSKKEKRQLSEYAAPIAVHKTMKHLKDKQNAKNRHNDHHYVDLNENGEKVEEKNERRRYGWGYPRQLYYRPMGNRRQDRPSLGRLRGDEERPSLGRLRGDDYNYLQYENDARRTLDDEVQFEKALSYGMEPQSRGEANNYNNPEGNNLYSVDEGHPDTIEPFYPQTVYPPMQQSPMRFEDYPESVSYQKFRIDPNKKTQNVVNIPSVTNPSSCNSTTTTPIATTIYKDDTKTVKRVGNGFIEVSKFRRDNSEEEAEEEEEETDRESNVFDAPPRRESNDYNYDENEEHFQSRRLKFIDDDMVDAENHYEDYENLPPRSRRDFLDALGMKNEEDYSEDNPYKKDLDVNNTDIKNDTYLKNMTLANNCHNTETTTSSTSTTSCILKEDMNTIKEILEQPKEVTAETTIGNFKESKEKRKENEKRAKRRYSDIEDFDDVTETPEVRKSRGITKELQEKLLEHKNKIYNSHEDTHLQEHEENHPQMRQVRKMPRWSNNVKVSNNVKKSIKVHHKINKKEDMVIPEETFTTVAPATNITETESTNSTYEEVAHQMDMENEKLAQVVNGHLASKIVSTVFEELKRKLPLKTKFYSGLSRKHVNFAGTIDFDIFKANETEDVDEARLLLEQITKVLNKLVLNQVRRKLCQRLPDELKEYLQQVLNIKTSLEMNNFVPNVDQGNFLFKYQEDTTPPFDIEQLQRTLLKLEKLLLDYHNMNQDCQNRAKPVKDYIEDHVKMLKQIVTCPDRPCGEISNDFKRDTPMFQSDLIEKQLESVGLGRNHDFVPNFDLNQLVKSKLKDNAMKADKKRDTGNNNNNKHNNNNKSEKYKKLQLAAEKVREKRENEKKIAEMFGKKKRQVSNVDIDYEEPVVYSLG